MDWPTLPPAQRKQSQLPETLAQRSSRKPTGILHLTRIGQLRGKHGRTKRHLRLLQEQQR